MLAVAWNMLKPENLTDRHNEDQVARRLIVSVARNLDREAFGFSDLDTFFADYNAAGGAPVDRNAFRFWLV